MRGNGEAIVGHNGRTFASVKENRIRHDRDVISNRRVRKLRQDHGSWQGRTISLGPGRPKSVLLNHQLVNRPARDCRRSTGLEEVVDDFHVLRLTIWYRRST